MTESLRSIVSQVRASTDTIATSSQQIASGNMDLSSRTEEQASSLEETASSMEELTSTVKQNADNARQAKQAIVKGMLLTSELIDTLVVAEGVETKAGKTYLAGLGMHLMQGYYFCKPVFRGLDDIDAAAWD